MRKRGNEEMRNSFGAGGSQTGFPCFRHSHTGLAHSHSALVKTGAQFLGRESNSHYHLYMLCLRAVDSPFQGRELRIPEEVRGKLTTYQKVYLPVFRSLCNHWQLVTRFVTIT